MRRRAANKLKIVEYTLTTNQGAVDVYVSGEYVGTASMVNSTTFRLVWQAEEYTENKTITLQNITLPPPYTEIIGTGIDCYRIISTSTSNWKLMTSITVTAETIRLQLGQYGFEMAECSRSATITPVAANQIILQEGVKNIELNYTTTQSNIQIVDVIQPQNSRILSFTSQNTNILTINVQSNFLASVQTIYNTGAVVLVIGNLSYSKRGITINYTCRFNTAP